MGELARLKCQISIFYLKICYGISRNVDHVDRPKSTRTTQSQSTLSLHPTNQHACFLCLQTHVSIPCRLYCKFLNGFSLTLPELTVSLIHFFFYYLPCITMLYFAPVKKNTFLFHTMNMVAQECFLFIWNVFPKTVLENGYIVTSQVCHAVVTTFIFFLRLYCEDADLN